MENINKEKYKKEPNRNFGAEKYNNWNEKVTKRYKNRFELKKERQSTLKYVK